MRNFLAPTMLSYHFSYRNDNKKRYPLIPIVSHCMYEQINNYQNLSDKKSEYVITFLKNHVLTPNTSFYILD